MESLIEEVGLLLREQKLTLGIVESATGGLISHLITEVAGSSDYYRGSIIAYSNEVKIKLVGVKKETVARYGAVSPQVAEEMASGGRQKLNVDICVSDTGIAGPGGATPSKPVGLFYFGLSHQKGTCNKKHLFQGDRKQNKSLAAETTLLWLKEYLLNLRSGKLSRIMLQERHVVTCFLESEGKILLLRRSKKVSTYQGKWAAVSGSIDDGIDEQAFTEILEETRLTPQDIKLVKKGKPLDVIDLNINTKWIVHPYLFHVNNPDKIQIDWEHKEIKWIRPEEIASYLTVPKLKETLLEVMRKEI